MMFYFKNMSKEKVLANLGLISGYIVGNILGIWLLSKGKNIEPQIEFASIILIVYYIGMMIGMKKD